MAKADDNVGINISFDSCSALIKYLSSRENTIFHYMQRYQSSDG